VRNEVPKLPDIFPSHLQDANVYAIAFLEASAGELGDRLVAWLRNDRESMTLRHDVGSCGEEKTLPDSDLNGGATA